MVVLPPSSGQMKPTSPKTQKAFQQARELSQFENYTEALEILEKLIKKDPEFMYSYYLASDIHQIQNNTDQQISILKRACDVVNTNTTESLQKLLTVYYLNGRYKEGLDYYATLSAQHIQLSASTLHDILARLNFAVQAISTPTQTEISTPDSNLNTPYHDYWPSMGVEENEMVTSVLVCDTLANGSVFCQEDIYYSILENEKWNTVQPIGEQLNTDMNEGGHCLSADGNYLFFTACNRQNGMGSCDIFYCRKRNGRWSSPQPCSSPVNTEFWEGHPSLDGTGTNIYFSSERGRGQGGKDVWQAEITYLADGSLRFGELKNLGPTINSSGDEISPFMHFDSQTLYYSSDGHMGMGRQDIFKASKTANDWSKPINMGYPINTHNDEIGFIVNASGKMAWMASERNDKKDKDIYSLTVPQNLRPHKVVYYRGTVRDKYTFVPLKAEINWFNFTTDSAFLNIFSNENSGEFLVCLKSNANYSIHINKPGYLFYSQFVGLNNTRSIQKPFSVDILLEPIKPGKIMLLDNVFFDSDSYNIQPQSFTELEQLSNLLKENPHLKIEIRGHTDSTGSEEHNVLLSTNRAKAVFQYLLNQDIKEWRLSFKGYGSTIPISDNSTEKGRSQNRRTEAMVIK